uniref:DUF1735 and LamG domain-containing protein n=1 Tax=uncultured Draconibacterium sp. TaxID=1573823 RepID=UPI0032174D29
MKRKYILSFIIACMSMFFTGCEDAEYEVIDNSIYISDAVTSKSATLTMEEEVVINVNVRLAKHVENDVEIAIKLNADLLDSYNKANDTEFYSVPDFKLPEDAKVIIPAGEISAVYSFSIKDFNTEGKQYALGVELGEVLAGDVNKSVSQSKFIYLISKPLKVSVPVLNGLSGKITMAPESNWEISTNEWSLEFWSRMSGYNRNNQAVFSTGSKDHEIYIRFGDANKPYNYLQIKTLGGQVQTASDLKAGQWYHWAFVYDGTSLTIYRNGQQDVKFNPPTPKGGAVRFDYMKMISSGSYFVDQCAMSQVRLWKTAISQTQIENNMFFSVNPSNSDLIGYWPMDAGEGNAFMDITGNGHDGTADEGVVAGWEHNIRFDQQ